MTDCERWGHVPVRTSKFRWVKPWVKPIPWRTEIILRCWDCDLYLPEPPPS